MFRRFVCLGLAEGIPDHSTIWRFRNKLQELELLEELFKEINEQLSSRGLLIKNGHARIIDASVIQAKNNRRKKNAQEKTPKTLRYLIAQKKRLTVAKRRFTAFKSKAHDELLEKEEIQNESFAKATKVFA